MQVFILLMCIYIISANSFSQFVYIYIFVFNVTRWTVARLIYKNDWFSFVFYGFYVLFCFVFRGTNSHCFALLQACYGILKVPQGNWLCRTCALGVQPKCLLCPKRGGALKPTRSGTKWVHVSCALWIPEVGVTQRSRTV